jgi:hypothetical protein
MPPPCPALTMPFFSKPRHSTAVERRPVGYLPAFSFLWLPRGIPRILLSEAYQSSSQRSIPATVRSGSTLQKRRSVKTVGLAVRIFPVTTRTFTKDGALLEQGRGAAWHMWINERPGRGSAWARHAVCESAFTGLFVKYTSLGNASQIWFDIDTVRLWWCGRCFVLEGN